MSTHVLSQVSGELSFMTKTDHLETACIVHCAPKSSLFQTTGYRGCRRTSSWRSCLVPESFQPLKKQVAFCVTCAVVMRQDRVKQHRQQSRLQSTAFSANRRRGA